MSNYLKWCLGLSVVVLAGCASGITPIEVPVTSTVGGDVGEINNSISNSVQNIVSQMEWWHMATVVGLAWLVGWLSPGPIEIIRSFFSGLTEIVRGITSFWR
jgi:hypothetical protein